MENGKQKDGKIEIPEYLGTIKCDSVRQIGHDLTRSFSYALFDRQFRMHFRQNTCLHFSKIANRRSEAGSSEITSSIQIPHSLPRLRERRS